MIIDGHRSIDDAMLVPLQGMEEEFGGDPLSAEERAELNALSVKGEDLEAELPAHLKPIVDPEDRRARALGGISRAGWSGFPQRKVSSQGVISGSNRANRSHLWDCPVPRPG